MSSRARERTATAEATHSVRRFTHQGGTALGLARLGLVGEAASLAERAVALIGRAQLGRFQRGGLVVELGR